MISMLFSVLVVIFSLFILYQTEVKFEKINNYLRIILLIVCVLDFIFCFSYSMIVPVYYQSCKKASNIPDSFT